jgi:hypothetical protein
MVITPVAKVIKPEHTQKAKTGHSTFMTGFDSL